MRGIIGLIALVACLASFGCKQGEGDRCQIDDDCEDGLECGAGPSDTKVCEPKGGTPDAGPDFDAAPVPDAGPEPDAVATPDAALPDATPSFDAGT